MDVTTLIGVLGVSVLLVCFVLNQLRLLSIESAWYDGGNFVGAALLVVYAYLLNSIPFLVLESVWALFSLWEVLKGLKHGSR